MSDGKEKLREALVEVMSWIKNWDAPFLEDDEWPATQAKIEAALLVQQPVPEGPKQWHGGLWLHDRLGAYLNTMVADLGIEGKGQYLRDLFARFEAEVLAAQPAAAPAEMDEKTSARAPQPESQPKEWRTVIVGLPIIRKLLNGEDVAIDGFHINLIPDDVLFNNRPRCIK